MKVLKDPLRKNLHNLEPGLMGLVASEKKKLMFLMYKNFFVCILIFSDTIAA